MDKLAAAALQSTLCLNDITSATFLPDDQRPGTCATAARQRVQVSMLTMKQAGPRQLHGGRHAAVIKDLPLNSLQGFQRYPVPIVTL